MMKLVDLIIIYLACGAPFGVYFFFQNRENLISTQLWLKSFLNGLLWIPFALKLFHRFVTNKLHNTQFVVTNQTDSVIRLKIDGFEKIFSNYLFKNDCDLSLFEFRETFERYIGLTLSLPKDSETIVTDSEFFRITNHKNSKLGEICLQRRNRLRLESHQTQARKDLLKFFAIINLNILEAKKFRFQVFEFFGIFEDLEAQAKLDEIFQSTTQTENGDNVKQMENEVWKSKEHKPLPTQQTVLNLQTIQRTTLMSKPD